MHENSARLLLKIMKNGILSYIKVYSSKHKYLKVLEKLYCKKFQKKILDECKTLFYKSDFLVNLNANSNKNDTISDNITDITKIYFNLKILDSTKLI